MGVRLYNPTSGRFLSVDPIFGGSANAYEYGFGDPVNNVDLDGRFVIILALAIPAAGQIVGWTAAIVGGALVVAAAVDGVRYCYNHGCSGVLERAVSHISKPNPNSDKVKRNKNTAYIGYEIFARKWNGFGESVTWKYGISEARLGETRPNSQKGACNREPLWKGKGYGPCQVRIVIRTKGYWQIRRWEYGSILNYWAEHRHCPPGQNKTVCK